MNTSFFKAKIPTYLVAVMAFLLFMGFPFVNVVNEQEVQPALPPIPVDNDRLQIELLIMKLSGAARFGGRHDGVSLSGAARKQKRAGALSNIDRRGFALEVKAINIDKEGALVTIEAHNGKELGVDNIQLKLAKIRSRWNLTDAGDLAELFPQVFGNKMSKSGPASGQEPPPQMTPATIRMSDRALVPINHPWTNTPVINASLTMQHIQRRLFSDNAALDLEAIYVDAATQNAVSFHLDPYWDRIVFAQRSGNWIRSYGDHSGEYRFAGPKAMVVDPFGTIYVADSENGRIVKLHYASGAIQYVSDFTIPGLGHPVDVSLEINGAANPSYNHMWIADDFNGRLFELSPSGAVVQTVEYYTVGAQTYRLARPRKVLAAEELSLLWYPYVSFIDAERNAFVVADPNSVTGTTITAISSVEFIQPGSLLTSIGQDLTSEWWVADARLGMLHKFGQLGNYLTSVSGFAFPKTVTKAQWYFDASHTNISQYLYTAEPWGNTTGLRAFFPGADAIALQATQGSTSFVFSFVRTNMCRYKAKVVRASDNLLVVPLDTGSWGGSPV